MMAGWMGVFVIGFVCLWMVLLGLVLLRTALFMITLLWMGARQWLDGVHAEEE